MARHVVTSRSLVVLLLFLIGGISVVAQSDYPPLRMTGIAWSPSGRYLAMGYADGRVKIADTSVSDLWDLGRHRGSVHNLAWSSDDVRVASVSASPDNSLMIWNVPSRQRIHAIPNLGTDLYAVAWESNAEQILVIPIEEDAYVINAVSGSTIRTLRMGSVSDVIWDVLGNQIIIGGIGAIVVLDASTLGVQSVISENTRLEGQVVSLAWSSSTRAIAAGTSNGYVYIWREDSRQIIFEGRGNTYQGEDWLTGFVVALSFSPNGSTLSSISGDGTYRVWDIATQTILENRQLPAPIYAADWSPDRTKLAYGGADGEVHIEPIRPSTPPFPTAYPHPTRSPGGQPACPGGGGEWMWVDGELVFVCGVSWE